MLLLNHTYGFTNQSVILDAQDKAEKKTFLFGNSKYLTIYYFSVT